MDKITSFTQLDVWKLSHSLVIDIYKYTTEFPQEEKYGLVSQMRRCAVSVAANIAEGFKRIGRKDKAHFYNIAQASLEELHYYFILTLDLALMKEAKEPLNKIDSIAKMLTSLIRSTLQRHIS
ncbi:MAG: four helix bundle protein [Planctomycetes bacterium]|nr:four helix bundle protein [Planctomycetota bacterium]